jgi:8-oxo-dGTP diphosphatase
LKIFPVALALFHRKTADHKLEVWVQIRTDDGPFHGLLEFPGGGVEANEIPLEAAIREVEEEVGIKILASDSKFMGTYTNVLPTKTILLYVFLFPEQSSLSGKGQWLRIDESLSAQYQGKIPGPNHRIIDDLFRALYDVVL